MNTLTKMQRCVDLLRDLDPEMQLQAVATLLAIATRPGITQKELMNQTGLSDASVSRNCAMLGEYHRKGTAGLKLVEARVDLADRRVRMMHLTPRGERIILQLQSHLA